MKNNSFFNFNHHLLASVSVATLLVATTGAMAQTLPTGVTLESGSGSVSTPDAANMVIDQLSSRAIFGASTFDTSADATVTHNMPGADAIGMIRISDNKPSQFNGKYITPNGGQVWLINSNGFIFGSTANVDVGSLLVSTANITNDNFLNPGGSGAVDTKRYIFDEAGNDTAAIVIRNGAQIHIRQPQKEIVRLLTELGGELNSTANEGAAGVVTSNGSVLNAIDLKNWLVVDGSVDSIKEADQDIWFQKPTIVWNGPAGAKLSDSSNDNPIIGHQEGWFDLGGTGGADGTKGLATLLSKETFEVPEGNYSLTYAIAGTNRGTNTFLRVSFVDENGNDLGVGGTGTPAYGEQYGNINTTDPTKQGYYPREDVLVSGDGFQSVATSFSLTKPQKIRIKVTNMALDGYPSNPFAGAQLGDLKLTYEANQNTYATFNAPGIVMEGTPGPVVEKAIGRGVPLTGAGIIGYDAAEVSMNAGKTFTVDSAYDQQVVNVEIGEAVTVPAIVDGVPMEHAIDLQPGAYLWASLPRGPNSMRGYYAEVNVNAKVTQDAFNAFDANSNGNTDRRLTHISGMANETSDIISIGKGDARDGIQAGEDFHQATSVYPGYSDIPYNGGLLRPMARGNFNFTEVIVPNPPVPVVNIDEQLVNRKFDAQGRPVISYNDSAQADNFGPVRTNYVNYDGVRVENNLFGSGPTNPATGALGELAPAAGGSLSDLSPAAGGDDSSTACANEHLQDPFKKIQDEDTRCNIEREVSQAL